MYQTGVYFGRFCPPHRGHLYQMIEASTRWRHSTPPLAASSATSSPNPVVTKMRPPS